MICVTVRLDEDLLEDLMTAVADSGMSRSDYLRRIIPWALYGAPQEASR